MISNLVKSSIFLILFASCSSMAIMNERIELENLERTWLNAEFKADTAIISKLMDERFLSISPSGTSNKQEELVAIYKNITERIANKNVVESFHFEDFQVLFHKKTAVVTFTCVSRGKNQLVPFENRRTRIYDVWIKQNGKWKAISSQVTSIKQ